MLRPFGWGISMENKRNINSPLIINSPSQNSAPNAPLSVSKASFSRHKNFSVKYCVSSFSKFNQ